MRRKSGYIAWLIAILSIVALLLAWQYVDYRSASRTLPAGMTMAGIPVEGMTREQVFNALEVGFATPIEVMYAEQRLSLSPETAELRYEAEQTAHNLDAVLEARGGFDGFVAHVLRRAAAPVDVPVAVSYSPERVDSFLARVATQYDHPPKDPVPIPTSLTFRAGQPGYELDIEVSRAQLAAALVSATQHQVELVVRTEQAPLLQNEALRQMIETLLDEHGGLTAGIFVKDLQTGDELGINAGVAFDGSSVLKIAILEETYRALDIPLAAEVAGWISDTVGPSDGNLEANLLLRDVVGNGDGYLGVQNLNASMKYLGLVNTFMAAPYDEPVFLTIATPANSRTDVTTDPGQRVQTTPLDIGMLLEMVYECSRGGGGLNVAYPGAFAVEECNEMVEWMSKNRIDSLIEAGVPAGTRVAHKHGITGDTHADAGLIFTPGGDFVLVAFVYRPEWLTWEESAPLISDIGAVTYNFFNVAR